MARQTLVAPKSGIQVIQGITVAIYEWRVNGYIQKNGVLTKHHELKSKVYWRGGKRRCIERFQSMVNVTASIPKKPRARQSVRA